MNQACFSQNTTELRSSTQLKLNEPIQNVSCIRPIKNYFVRIKKIIGFVCYNTLLLSSIYGNNIDTVSKHKNPTFAQVQYAGNMGLVSIGIGKSFFSERLSTCLIYGYLPENTNGADVHTVALKSYYTVIKKQINPKSALEGYLGASIIRGITKNTYLKYPSQYPKNYYPPNAYHLALFTGAKHTALIKNNKLFEKIAAFIEFGTIDYELWYGIKTDYIGFFDLWNVSFGITLNFLSKK
jgi:hypothetical protein